MRYIIIISFILTFTNTGVAQEIDIIDFDTISTDNEMITYIETPPKFPGGEDSLWCFFESNLDFNILNFHEKHGKVLAFFEIDTTGKVVNIKTNPVYTQRLEWLVNDSLIETEIKRVLELSPIWTPGSQRDKPIKISYTLPIKIPYTDFKCANLNNPTAAYWKVDKYAEFRYQGEKETKNSIERFIGENGIWPSQDDCTGKVYVRVIINEKGELSDYNILRGLNGCRGFNDEALRIVRIMPRWKPAEINGKPVKSYNVIPISFILR